MEPGGKQRKIDTEALLDILNGHSGIGDTLDKISDNITNPVLCEYLSELMRTHGHTPAGMIKKANLSKSHAYQILNGSRMPNRNLLIRISFAIGLSLKETQRLLTVSQRGLLYPRVRRDAAIIFCLNKRCTLEQANDLLEDIGEAVLV